MPRQSAGFDKVMAKRRAKLTAAVQPVLRPGETVLDITHGMATVYRLMWASLPDSPWNLFRPRGIITRRNASLVVTDQRVFVFSKCLRGRNGYDDGRYDVQNINYGSLILAKWYPDDTPFDIQCVMELVTKREADRTRIDKAYTVEAERIVPVIQNQMVLWHQAAHHHRGIAEGA